jgi:hypothetical protein
LSLKVFISSDCTNTFFVDKTFEAINEKSEEVRNAIGIEIQPIYPPRQSTTGMTVEEKINQIRDSNLIIMNITPRIVSNEYVVNSGVLVEYGVVLGLDETENLCILCDREFERTRLSPIFHGHDIQQFSQRDEGTELKNLIKSILSSHISRIVQRSRQLAQSDRIAHDFIQVQIRSADNAT